MTVDQLMTKEEFCTSLRAIGPQYYHHKHPFHLLMHEGMLTRRQMQAWAINRYYYQSIIPQKDAAIISRSSDMDFRRAWRKRIEDHDGSASDIGGLEKWIQLAEATGVPREIVVSERFVLPGVRFSADAYLDLVRSSSLLEAVASSLTEMFSTELITLRVKNLETKYEWMAHGLSYFKPRLTQAPLDAAFALNYVCENARSRHEQELCLEALRKKCRILWAQLDAIHHAYVSPALPPPGYELPTLVPRASRRPDREML